MNTKELAKELQVQFEEITETKLSADKSRALIDLVFDTIGDSVATGEKISITGFGDFERVERAERNARNPQTGEAIVVPAQFASKFKPAKKLKDKVKGK